MTLADLNWKKRPSCHPEGTKFEEIRSPCYILLPTYGWWILKQFSIELTPLLLFLLPSVSPPENWFSPNILKTITDTKKKSFKQKLFITGFFRRMIIPICISPYEMQTEGEGCVKITISKMALQYRSLCKVTQIHKTPSFIRITSLPYTSYSSVPSPLGYHLDSCNSENVEFSGLFRSQI